MEERELETIPPEVQAQLDLEVEMADLGAARYMAQYRNTLDKGRPEDTKPGQFLIRNAVAPVSDAVKAYVAEAFSGKPGKMAIAARLLKEINPDVVAYLAVKSCLSVLTRPDAPLAVLARSISRLVENEARFSHFETSEKGRFKYVMKKLKEEGATEVHKHRVLTFYMGKYGVDWNAWSMNDSLHLGIRLAEIVSEVSGIMEIKLVREDERIDNRKTKAARSAQTRYIVNATPKLVEWFEKRAVSGSLTRPAHLPMIIPPREWKSLKGGGYYAHVEGANKLIKRMTLAHKLLLTEANMTDVYAAVNAVQNTSWQINSVILDVAEAAWNGEFACELLPPQSDLPLPPKPHDIDDNRDSLIKWKRAAHKVHTNNVAIRSDRLNAISIIETAKRFSEYPAIYFPHNLDFRGRMYPLPTRLNPQGEDFAKGLLRFSEGKPLNDPVAIGWFMIHGANTFGYDKASLEDRIDWAYSFHDHIMACAEDPRSNRWWTEADKPWQFLAWCFEYGAKQVNKEHFVSHLPIALDGSCNGLQHFSAMLRDPVGGAAVNLVPSDKPQDIYQRVADRVMVVLSEYKGEPEKERWAAGWKAFGVNRTITKRPVMVLPYGGTRNSCLNYVKDGVKVRVLSGTPAPFGDDEMKGALSFLAGIVWDAIGDVVVAAREAMTWLQKTSRVVTKADMPLSWTVPSGFVVYQKYNSMKSNRVITKVSGSTVKFRVNAEIEDKIDGSRQATAISPNFVHSYDASTLALTVCISKENGIDSFAMVHDSYGTHAADTEKLAHILRAAFVSSYTDYPDPLPTIIPVGVEAPPLPEKGTLDLSNTLQSDYFFA